MPDRSEKLGLSIGDRVQLLHPHPWRGHVGRVVRIDSIAMLGGEVGAAVELDGQAGLRCGVTKRAQFRVIDDG